MDQVAGVIGVTIVFGLVVALGEWLFRRFTDRLDARLHAGWRWLTLPITAIVSSDMVHDRFCIDLMVDAVQGIYEEGARRVRPAPVPEIAAAV